MTELLKPGQWLLSAERDLTVARLTEEQRDDCAVVVAFHAQQCAERALKAVLIARELDLPRTHSLELLLSKLRAGGVAVPPSLLAAAGLTPYAMELRYATADTVSPDEARAAVRIAEAVLTWARAQVGPST